MSGRVARGGMWFYHRIASPLLHSTGVSSCRFQPTCSDYAEVAVARFGWLHGGWLAVCRILRCHPFSRGGLDQVPLRREDPARHKPL